MPTHLDSIFFHWSGPSLMPTHLSAVPCRLLLSVVPRQAPFPNSLLASPYHFRSREIFSPKPFVWFRAKTDKGIVCLAGHLHSVTPHAVTNVVDMTLNNLMVRFQLCWKLWGMPSNSLSPSLPGPFWFGVVTPDKGPIYGLNRAKPCFLHNTDFCV